MAISGTGDLPVEQVQIVFAAAGAERGSVGLKLLDSTQLPQHQPREGVEPRHAAQHPREEEVERMTLPHMMRLMGEDATQLLVAEATRAHHYLVEEGIGRGVVVREDERGMARNVESIARPIDSMLPSEPDDSHRLGHHLEHKPGETYCKADEVGLGKHIRQPKCLRRRRGRDIDSIQRHHKLLRRSNRQRCRGKKVGHRQARNQYTERESQQQIPEIQLQPAVTPKRETIQTIKKTCCQGRKNHPAYHDSNSLVIDSRSSRLTSFLSTRNDTSARADPK